MADVSQIKLPNGSVYDLIDEKSGYITAEYIENKTDYEIPVSRVGEIVVGETAIGTDSTNFPTSKAVVDYVDERVVQEMDAIDVGVTGIQANGTSLSVVDGVVNIPAIGPNQSVGLMTDQWMQQIWNRLNSIPTSTSQLTNDSGFVTSDEKLAVSRNLNNGGVYEVVLGSSSNPINTETKFQSKTLQYSLFNNTASLYIGNNSARGELRLYGPQSNYSTRIRSTTTPDNYTIYLPDKEGTIALTSDIPSVPSWALQSTKPTYTANEVGALPSTTVIPLKTSQLTNDSGYLTASDIASVMTYKGTKANYAALPSTGNTTGDVWHLTDTGAEWAWDGSSWQELGTAIDLSGYATKATTLAGYGITDAKIQNGVITLGSNTITPLTSFTETDPVFSASAAAGITSTDISNWNAKVSDDKTWNGVSLTKTTSVPSANTKTYIPYLTSTSGTGAILMQVVNSPTANSIVRYDGSAYLYSTTPSANDNSTKVATTAYVDAAIPNTSGFVSKSGDTMSGNLTFAYNNGIIMTMAESTSLNTPQRLIRFITTGQTGSGNTAYTNFRFKVSPSTQNQAIQIYGIHTPEDTDTSYDTYIASKKYVDDSIPKVYSSTNTGGYLTMATLPIYDGTVV